MSTTCSICCEDVPKLQKISCPQCELEVCKDCVVRFVKTLSGDVTCMGCKHPWDRAFIFRNLPPSLVHKEFKAQREGMLFDRETALLPVTSQLVPLVKQHDALLTHQKQLRAEMAQIRMALAHNTAALNVNRQSHRQLMDAITGRVPVVSVENTDTAEKKPKVVCSCPVAECRGFIFDNHKCSLCDVRVCKKCHSIRAADHECKPEDVASVALIKQECKACPGCNVPSRKTEGCNQVWCLMCHTTWDWHTQKVDTAAIHATDYFRFMERNGVALPAGAAPNPCGAPENIPRRIQRIKTKFNLAPEDFDFIMIRWQKTQEIDRYAILLPPTDNTDIRMKYLQGEIDEKKWKQVLHKRDKATALQAEVHKMKVAYSAAMQDAIATLVRSTTIEQVQASTKYMQELHNIMEEEYRKLALCFNSKAASPFTRR